MNHTNRHPAIITLTLALFAFSLSANASISYDFSYNISDGNTLSGSFDGTASGNLITNITNLSVSYDGGAPVTGLKNSSFTSTGPVFGGAVISINGLANNFSFTDGPNPSTYFTYAFLSLTDPSLTTPSTTYIEYHIPGSGGIFKGDNPFIPANWSVSLTAVPVPSALWLFGSALAGVIGFNRKKSLRQ